MDSKKKEFRKELNRAHKKHTVPVRKMTNGELKEYLNTFPDDANISIILANPRERKLYEVVNAFGVLEVPNLTFCIDVGKASDMDAEMVSACDADEEEAEQLAGQMDISDFPEVMP